MAEAVGTCQGSPLRFDRSRGARGGLDRTLAPLPRRKSHEAGALNKRNLGFMQCSPSCTQIAPQRAANEE